MDNVFVDIKDKGFTVQETSEQEAISTNILEVGKGSKVFRTDLNGLWLGAESFADAPFAVDMEGNAYMASASLTGYVESEGGDYSTSTTGARLLLLPDSNTGMVVYDNTNTKIFEIIVGGTNIGDISIGDYANNNGMLWDDSASNFEIRGTMNAGEVVGTTFKTSATGTRIQLDANGDRIKIIDSGDDSGLEMYLTGSTSADIESKDSRDLRFITATGIVDANSNRIVRIEMAQFNENSSAPDGGDGIYYYKSGGNYAFRSRMEGGNWQFDQSGA